MGKYLYLVSYLGIPTYLEVCSGSKYYRASLRAPQGHDSVAILFFSLRQATIFLLFTFFLHFALVEA